MGFYHIRCRIDTDVSYMMPCSGCELTFTNHETGAWLEVINVRHWSYKTVLPGNPADGQHFIYFAPKLLGARAITADTYSDEFASRLAHKASELFPSGSRIDFNWTVNSGRDAFNSHCLSLVHGVDKELEDVTGSQAWLGYGTLEIVDKFDFRAHTTLVNEDQRLAMSPGSTYGKKQFLISGSGLKRVRARSEKVRKEVAQFFSNAGDLTGRPLEVVTNGIVFGVNFGSRECSGTRICQGSTTSQLDDETDFTIPYFFIQCGNSHYFGGDLYHFAKDKNSGHLCANSPDGDIKPEFQLLGFFKAGECGEAKTIPFDEKYCETATTAPTATFSELPSKAPTFSSVPTNYVTPRPTPRRFRNPAVNRNAAPLTRKPKTKKLSTPAPTHGKGGGKRVAKNMMKMMRMKK
mmetsp:Transcript_3457/g.4409  ORF Transcript_3457/g.4409 Transcript_3457/m.4409 type:complete len:406 (+) Transcript_3457:1-1218(+)